MTPQGVIYLYQSLFSRWPDAWPIRFRGIFIWWITLGHIVSKTETNWLWLNKIEPVQQLVPENPKLRVGLRKPPYYKLPCGMTQAETDEKLPFDWLIYLIQYAVLIHNYLLPFKTQSHRHNKKNNSTYAIRVGSLFANKGWSHKKLETHGCVLSTVSTDALVLNHRAISIRSAD